VPGSPVPAPVMDSGPPPPGLPVPAPVAAEAAPAPSEPAEAKPNARSHRHHPSGDEAKADPAHLQIPVPAEDTTPAELKNPFHTP